MRPRLPPERDDRSPPLHLAPSDQTAEPWAPHKDCRTDPCRPLTLPLGIKMHCVRACHPFAPHARRCASMASVGGRNCAGYCAGLGSNRIAALAGVKKTPTNQAASDCIVIKHASTAERRESLTPVGFAALRRRNIKVIATIALMHHGKRLPGDDRLRLASVRLRRRATSIATRTIHF